jgi:cobalt-zinc-cadmium efflux system protein
MGHDHHHHGDHGHAHHSPTANDAAFGIGVALNLGFVLVEAYFGIVANSVALLSDAAHNLSDVLALAIAWGAARLARSAPTKHRTYGLRRTSILAALVNAAALLLVVGGIAWEAMSRLVRPEAVAGGTVIAVALVGALINAATAMLFFSRRRSDLNVRGAYLHMAADAAISLGVALSGALILATGWTWLDPASSLLVSAVIVWATWDLLADSVRLALDAVPSGIDPHAVEAFLGGLPGVAAVHDLHIWGMSTTEAALTAHLVMPQPPADDHFINRACHDLQHRFQIGHVTLQIEHGTADLHCRQAPEDAV